MLDTDILIDIQRGHLPAVAWFKSLTDVPSVPGLVAMELIQDAQNSQQVRTALKLVAPLPIVWPSVVDCDHAHIDIAGGKIWIQRDGTEHGIANDLITAGITKDQIVLGFQAPEARQYTEFATM